MTAVFINPKVDYAFKIIFGSEKNESILISFLNAMIYDGAPVIKDVAIINPYLPSDVDTHKDTYVDVQAWLDDGSIVLIEMQTSHTRAFFKRVLYNTAKRYSGHLEKGVPYTDLIPVISLILADFTYHEDHERPLSTFKLTEVEDHFLYPAADDFRIVIVELPKFNKAENDVDTLTDKWLFFMQNAKNLQEVPPMLQKTREIKSAFEVARRANLDQLELIEIDRRERDAATALRELELTWEEALEEGISIGRQEGRQEGRLEGGQERELQIVSAMLAQQVAPEDIARMTAVPLADILQIEQDLHDDQA